MISSRLCGGMLVAIPTAMPPDPLTSRFGITSREDCRLFARLVVVGNEVDGIFVYVGQHLRAMRVSLASVYR